MKQELRRRTRNGVTTMARTGNPAPHAARSAAGTAPDADPRGPLLRRRASPAAAVLAALMAEPGVATVAAIAGHAGITVAAARRAAPGRSLSRWLEVCVLVVLVAGSPGMR
jgi:hypothetical protein